MQRQPGAGGRVVVSGYSRGSEAALLLAEADPALVGGVIDYAPSDSVNSAYPVTGSAWTRAGRPVPGGSIPVARVAAPVLAIAGDHDRVWLSALQAHAIMANLDAAGLRYPHRALVYPGSGHGVGTFPYLPTGTYLPDGSRLGGTRAADQQARQRGWAEVLAFLARIDG